MMRMCVSVEHKGQSILNLLDIHSNKTIILHVPAYQVVQSHQRDPALLFTGNNTIITPTHRDSQTAVGNTLKDAVRLFPSLLCVRRENNAEARGRRRKLKRLNCWNVWDRSLSAAQLLAELECGFRLGWEIEELTRCTDGFLSLE